MLELWDVLIGNMSFVGPRPDVPGDADQLQGDDRVALKLRPGITGPAILKYRLKDEMLASLRLSPEEKNVTDWQGKVYDISKSFPLGGDLEEAAIWFNDGSTSLTTGTVIYPDKVRLNLYYYNHYSLTCGRACSCSAIGKQACHCSRVLAAFWKDIEMIFATVLGRKVKFAGEEV